jgi:ABC transporter substrate binding protein
MMRRREFIAGLGGAAAWPLVGRAQQANGIRRIGVLMNLGEVDPEGTQRVFAWIDELKKLGWVEGLNLQTDIRGCRQSWPGPTVRGGTPRACTGCAFRIWRIGGTATEEATRTIPLVFVNVVDPVGSGIVESLARPGSNATGFTQFDHGLSGKWLEVLMDLAPAVRRVAVLRDPSVSSGIGRLAARAVHSACSGR